MADDREVARAGLASAFAPPVPVVHVSDGRAPAPAAGGQASFRPLSSSVDVGFFAWEIATGEVICDPVTYRMHGMAEQQVGTMDAFLARVPEEDLAQVRAEMARMTAACGDYQLEYRVRGADGSLRSMQARGRVAPGADGQPARMMGLVIDTTAERARRDAEDRHLRELADRARRTRDFTVALTSAVTVDAVIRAARDNLHVCGADSFVVVAQADGRLTPVASHGFGEKCLELLTSLESPGSSPVSAAIHWRVPVYVESPEALAADYPRLAEAASHCPQRAWVALPAFDSAGNVGACMFGFPARHAFPVEERALLYTLSGLLAQSLERARMLEAYRAIARELQDGMLPRQMANAAGLSVATRYRAATSGIEIGGDFYDAVQLSGSQVALVIGDVQGHNLIAASLMGRLRTAVHAYAREGHGAAEVMARANRWLATLEADPDRSLFATCCIASVDPAAGRIAVCRAGHPPPVLIEPGRQPRAIRCEAGLPLGVDAGASYRATDVRVPPGSVLALVTDGLLEAEAGDEHNLGHLLQVLGQGPADDLEALAATVLSQTPRPARHSDDVALLLARIGPPAGGAAASTAKG